MTSFNINLVADSVLPHVNASLNATATVLLVLGFVLIKMRRETAHKIAMGSAFATSIAFLICYVIYHATKTNLGTPFPREAYPNVAVFYYLLLISHVLLAMVVPVLAVITIFFGWKDRRTAHKTIARWTLPIWLYVSVTGVVIYFMLYWVYVVDLDV